MSPPQSSGISPPTVEPIKIPIQIDVCMGTPKFGDQSRHRIETGGDPGRIRTCNPQSRNLVLYPVELRDRLASSSTGNMKNPLPPHALFEPISRRSPQSHTPDPCT